MTLYALRPDPVMRSLHDAEVVDESKYGWQFLEQAVTLWRLLDNTRADEILAIMGRASIAAGDGELCFHAPDLHELVRLLTGVEDAVIAAGIVDQHWRVPSERVEELAKLVPTMDLKTERSLKARRMPLARS